MEFELSELIREIDLYLNGKCNFSQVHRVYQNTKGIFFENNDITNWSNLKLNSEFDLITIEDVKSFIATTPSLKRHIEFICNVLLCESLYPFNKNFILDLKIFIIRIANILRVLKFVPIEIISFRYLLKLIKLTSLVETKKIFEVPLFMTDEEYESRRPPIFLGDVERHIDDDNICFMCFEEITPFDLQQNKVVQTSKCEHLFHKECVLDNNKNVLKTPRCPKCETLNFGRRFK